MKKIVFTLLLVATVGLMDGQILNYSVGDVVSDFTVTDTEGTVHNLYFYTSSGKYVFLDFFFTTCGPCQATVPFFNEMYDKYGCNEGDMICLEINLGNDTDEEVIEYSATYGGSFHHSPAISGDGGSGDVNDDFNPAAYPTYCIVGPDNTLLHEDIWPVTSLQSFEDAFPDGFEPQIMPCTVNVDENDSVELSVSLFPNPASDNIQINLGDLDFKGSVLVYDLTGKLVFQNQTLNFNGTTALSVVDLESGMYLLELYSENHFIASSRFTVSR